MIQVTKSNQRKGIWMLKISLHHGYSREYLGRKSEKSVVGSSTIVELTDPESHALERRELTAAVHDFGMFQDILVTYGNEIYTKRSGFFPVSIARASRVTREIVTRRFILFDPTAWIRISGLLDREIKSAMKD